MRISQEGIQNVLSTNYISHAKKSKNMATSLHLLKLKGWAIQEGMVEMLKLLQVKQSMQNTELFKVWVDGGSN